MRRLFIGILLIVLVYLQFRLWSGEGSVAEIISLKEKIMLQQRENGRLYQRNNLLTNEIIELQNGLQTVEEEARQELGMIKRDETFYLIYD
ncbi:septum formation initiator family protein [Endozoicomonas sp. Mp262]|uniref:septum formation initiator family protein n=1 Tax=Endozoicomonas sp. Mp262 TaxID=2919499 RepID=UPI0021DAE2DE